MTAKNATAPDDEDQSTEQLEPSRDEIPETSRIAALLRDRFGMTAEVPSTLAGSGQANVDSGFGSVPNRKRRPVIETG
jgi:hypothetical protein